MATYVGVDIGGTKCAVSVWDITESSPAAPSPPAPAARVVFPTAVERGPDRIIGELFATIRGLIADLGILLADVRGIGVSCGGPLDRDSGWIYSPPNLPGWDRIPIVSLLEGEFGVPAALENDANACAVAEWRYGAARGFHNVVFLTFGTGLGAGLILNDRLYAGASGMAGEIGHVRLEPSGPVGYGKSGSVEGFCSGGGIAQLGRLAAVEAYGKGMEVGFCRGPSYLDEITAAGIAEAARRGDLAAGEVFQTSGGYLGRTLAVLVDLLNPDLIVIGSIFARARDLLWPAAERVLRQESLEPSLNACRVVPAGLGDRIGDFAALSVAIRAAGRSSVGISGPETIQ